MSDKKKKAVASPSPKASPSASSTPSATPRSKSRTPRSKREAASPKSDLSSSTPSSTPTPTSKSPRSLRSDMGSESDEDDFSETKTKAAPAPAPQLQKQNSKEKSLPKHQPKLSKSDSKEQKVAIQEVIYEKIKTVGSGAYGEVSLAKNVKTGEKVAIKRCAKVFEDLIDAKRILREIKILQHCRHRNIIQLVDMIPPPNAKEFNDVDMVLEFLEFDLHKVVKSVALKEDQIRSITYDILCGLNHLHSANIIHRDLKPSNVLLNSSYEAKICDFGLARGVNMHDDYELTQYVVTRWYRAPELMCSENDYSFGIDIWSVGCIVAEMINRRPLFPGDNHLDQLTKIIGVVGTPSVEQKAFMKNDRAKKFIEKMRPAPKIPFAKLYKNASADLVDFLEKTLVFDPTKRITVKQALAHPLFKNIRRAQLEANAKSHLNFNFEKTRLTKPVLQDMFYSEAMSFRLAKKA